MKVRYFGSCAYIALGSCTHKDVHKHTHTHTTHTVAALNKTSTRCT